MPREVKEWVGRTDDSPVPPRVILRVAHSQGNECAACGMPFGPKRKPQGDHYIALINGGKNDEDNIVAICDPCHKAKTKRDVAEKSKVSRVRKKHLGIVTKRHGFQKPDPTKFERVGFGRYERIKT